MTHLKASCNQKSEVPLFPPTATPLCFKIIRVTKVLSVELSKGETIACT